MVNNRIFEKRNKSNNNEEVKFIVVFGIIILALLVLFYSSHNNKQAQAASRKLVEHTKEVIRVSERVNSLLTEVENNSRGFLLMGKESFNASYHASSLNIQLQLNELKRLTRDNASQQIRIAQLEQLVYKRLAFTESSVKLAREKGLEMAVSHLRTEVGVKLSQQIRKQVDVVQIAERVLLEQRSAENAVYIRRAAVITNVLQWSLPLLLLLVLYLLLRSFKIRRVANSQLRESREWYSKTLLGIGDGIIATDADQKITFMNPVAEKLTGWSFDDAYAKHVNLVFKLVSESTREEVKNSVEAVIESGQAAELERGTLLVTKDGKELPVNDSAAPVLNDDGKLLGIVLVFRDFSKQKAAEKEILEKSEALQEANKELESFSYSVSHDLRAPLRAIEGYTNILKEDYGSKLDEDAVKSMDVISRNAKRMNQLIEDLLKFSRSGKQSLTKQQLDMTSLVKEIADSVKDEYSQVTIKFNISDLHPGFADESMIRQVIFNLLSNAVKYSSKKDVSIVEFGSYAERNTVVYFCKDNGTGFDMKYYEKLFGVFQRLHSNKDFEGTGVGLALVQRIVQRHGGKVWAQGKEGEGATFYFSLPEKTN